jgi:hypothetical protein
MLAEGLVTTLPEIYQLESVERSVVRNMASPAKRDKWGMKQPKTTPDRSMQFRCRKR